MNIPAGIADKLWYTLDKYSDIGHEVLNTIGLVWDGADLINAIWYALDGDVDMALTSALCALPFVGGLIGGAVGLATQVIGCGMILSMYAANAVDTVKQAVKDYREGNLDWKKALLDIGITIGVITVVGILIVVIRKPAKNAKEVPNGDGSGSALEDYVDLTDFRKDHILNSHRSGADKSGKTEFPTDWSDDKILHYVSDVATDPNSITGYGKWNSPYAIGTREGIEIRVDFYPESHPKYSGMISTAYPTNTLANP